MRQRTKAASPIRTGARAFDSTVLDSSDTPFKVTALKIYWTIEPESSLLLRGHTWKV